MGAVWLATLPQVLRDAGLNVDTYPGWEHRSRSSGGYDKLMGIQVHHTASNTRPENDMGYMWRNAPARPIGAIYLARDGKVTVGAAGATNTSGKGGPLHTSKGTIPLNAGNRYLLAIEAANAGNGEVWPKPQQESYVKMVAALCKAYNIPPSFGDINSHFEWSPGRKNDPAGSSKWASGRNMWDMDAFRADVAEAIAPTPPPKPPIPTEGTTDMLILDLNPGTDWWVAMVLDATTCSHIVNGHHVSVMERGGVPRVTLNETELDGVLRSVKTINDSPFQAGTPSHNQALNDLWNSRK